MQALVSAFRRLTDCCSKGGTPRYLPDDSHQDYKDDDSYYGSVSGSPSKQAALHTRMQDRIAQYKDSISSNKDPEQPQQRSPSYQRSNSTSNVIAMYETMAKPSPQQQQPPSLPSDSVILFPTNKESCAACARPVYPTDATVTSYGRLLHAACFACHLCHTKLTHHPLEVQFEIPNPTGDDDDDDRMQLAFGCAKCQEASRLRDKPKVRATHAGERILVGNEEWGDVQGVHQVIGDELERLLLDHVPKCATCGGDFLQYQGKVCMVGQVKYHQVCWETGKPSELLGQRSLPPSQAIKLLPERLILRIMTTTTTTTCSTDGTQQQLQPLATLFLHWPQRIQDLKEMVTTSTTTTIQQPQREILTVAFELDNRAVGNPNFVDPTKRKEQVNLSEEHVLTCTLVGEPWGTTTTTTTTTKCDGNQEAVFHVVVTGIKCDVEHQLHLYLPILSSSTTTTTQPASGLVLDLMRATVNVSLSKKQPVATTAFV